MPSTPIDKFIDHYVLVLDLTTMQDALEKYHWPKLVGQPLRLEQSFTFNLEHVSLNSLFWENECIRLQLTSLALLENKSKMDNVSLQEIFQRILLPTLYPYDLSDFIQTCLKTHFCRPHKRSITALLSFFSKLKSADIKTTGQYRNYQTFSNLQLRPLLESCFHSIHHDFGDTRIEKSSLCLCRYQSSAVDV